MAGLAPHWRAYRVARLWGSGDCKGGLTMPKSQRGVTFIGWLVLLAPVALLVYAGIRLTPIYLNYFHVVRALEQLATASADDPNITPAGVHLSISKRFSSERCTPAGVMFGSSA